MNRRLFAAVSAGVLALSLTACGGKDDPAPTGSASAAPTTAASTSAAPTTASADGEKVTTAILDSVEVDGSKLYVPGVEGHSDMIAQAAAAFENVKIEPEECKKYIVGEMASLNEQDIADADMAIGMLPNATSSVLLSKGVDFQIRGFENYAESQSKCATISMDMGDQKLEVETKDEDAPAVEGWDEVRASAVVMQGQEMDKILTARKGDYILTVTLAWIPGSPAPSLDVAVDIANQVVKKLK